MKLLRQVPLMITATLLAPSVAHAHLVTTGLGPDSSFLFSSSGSFRRRFSPVRRRSTLAGAFSPKIRCSPGCVVHKLGVGRSRFCRQPG